MGSYKYKPLLNSDVLHSRLKIRSLASESALNRNHPVASDFFSRLGLRPGKIRGHAAKMVTAGVLAGSLLMGQPQVTHAASFASNDPKSHVSVDKLTLTPEQTMFTSLAQSLPDYGTWKLDEQQEKSISQGIFESYGVHARAELDGKRLNHAYGRMGAEQHLPRFPGDTAEQHGQLVNKGITPGRGAWGYFASSKSALTQELVETEKWYVAVQTLYLPDWNTNTRELSKWYKHRRVVVVNPKNGKAVVAAVADAGPAEWTGKHFGGSPEVMEYLKINYGKQNHPVILFFLDDPEKEVALGPLEYNGYKEQIALRNTQ